MIQVWHGVNVAPHLRRNFPAIVGLFAAIAAWSIMSPLAGYQPLGFAALIAFFRINSKLAAFSPSRGSAEEKKVQVSFCYGLFAVFSRSEGIACRAGSQALPSHLVLHIRQFGSSSHLNSSSSRALRTRLWHRNPSQHHL